MNIAHVMYGDVLLPMNYEPGELSLACSVWSWCLLYVSSAATQSPAEGRYLAVFGKEKKNNNKTAKLSDLDSLTECDEVNM